jgi:hypothetical protein
MENLNKTELVEIIFRRYGKRVSPENSIEDLRKEVEEPFLSEIQKETRKRLAKFIEENWESIQTNIPCAGKPNAGVCTVFPCSTVTHQSCYSSAEKYLK